MKEIPISFIPDMARAVLRKLDPKETTRRVITHFDRSTYDKDPERVGSKQFKEGRWHLYPAGEGSTASPLLSLKCPHGEPGDRLRLLTTWAVQSCYDHLKPTDVVRIAPPDIAKLPFWHAGQGEVKPDWAGKLRPGRFMPLELRPRMPLLVNKFVIIERLQDVSEGSAVAEGCKSDEYDVLLGKFEDRRGVCEIVRNPGDAAPADFTMFKRTEIRISAKERFKELWNSINMKRGWGWFVNPLVFAVSFRREE